jgi:hypothetical protein
VLFCCATKWRGEKLFGFSPSYIHYYHYSDKEPDMLEKLKQEWQMLSRSIYTGERLEANLHALVAVSTVTAVLGLGLTVYDIMKGETIMALAAFNTFLGGLGCWICAGPLKNREAAAVIPNNTCRFIVSLPLKNRPSKTARFRRSYKSRWYIAIYRIIHSRRSPGLLV